MKPTYRRLPGAALTVGLFVPAILCLGCLWASPALGATSHGNYGLLRARLLDEFVVLGDDQGESQPMSERSDLTGQVRWGDSTIGLGFYIGVLATEYALLSDPETYPEMSRGGGDASDTITELGLALAALERLDAVADASFEAPCTQAEIVNGFFIRDDVPAEAWQDYAGATWVSSDFIDPTVTNKEMSQDQVYHLLGGLALVRLLVPDEAGDGAMASWASELALEIIEHMHAGGEWTITNPACEDRAVARGADASGYAVATSAVAAWFSDGAVVLDYPEYSETLAEVGRDPDSIIYSNVDNLHMAMVVSAVGDAWGETTTDDLMALSANEGWVLYPLLHQVVHGPTDSWCASGEDMVREAYEMLEELPIGDGPASPRPDTAVHGFTSWNRFIRGRDQAYVGPEDSEGMRYAGLDFMLLHNLLVLSTPGAWDGDFTASCPSELEDSGVPEGDAPADCGCAARPGHRAGGWLLLVLGCVVAGAARSRAGGIRLPGRPPRRR